MAVKRAATKAKTRNSTTTKAKPKAKPSVASKSTAPRVAKPAKRAGAKPTKPAVHGGNHRAPGKQAGGTFYFLASEVSVGVSDEKPAAHLSAVSLPNFEEAKERAIDHLIDLIDDCEQRLWALKRAGSYEEYQRAVAAE